MNKGGFPSTMLNLILLILLCYVFPMMCVSVIQWARAEQEASFDTRTFIDKVIDTRQISEDMLSDYNLALASKSTYYVATIKREVKVTNPVPGNPGETYVTYMTVDNIDSWEQGDIITVEVEAVGLNYFQIIARSFFYMLFEDRSFTYSGRIR